MPLPAATPGTTMPPRPAATSQEVIVQVIVSARHSEVSEADRTLVEEKLSRLGGKFLNMDRAEVHFFKERNPRIADNEVCEITMAGHGHHVRCKSNGPDPLTAVDLTIAKLENKLHKLKTKLSTHRKGGEAGRASRTIGDLDTVEERDGRVDAEQLLADYRIVKTKTVEIFSLTPVDAAMRMDLLGHSFYFFTNADTNRSAIVYRRDDGDIGLIDAG
ncbi:MAG: ribosome-associated translation inhibitor RaiA [Microthrixaceae bacterium]